MYLELFLFNIYISSILILNTTPNLYSLWIHVMLYNKTWIQHLADDLGCFRMHKVKLHRSKSEETANKTVQFIVSHIQWGSIQIYVWHDRIDGACSWDTREERPGEMMYGMRMARYTETTTTTTRVITMDTWVPLTLFWTNIWTFIQPLERVKDTKRLRNTRYKRWDGGERWERR